LTGTAFEGRELPARQKPERRTVHIAEKPRDAIAYHKQLAGDWERRYRKRSFRARQAVLLECLRGHDIEGRAWLDAGCGTGTLSRWLAERGCEVLGVDAAAEMIQRAVQLAEVGNTSRLGFEQVESVARLPLPGRSRDGILCSSVLEYLVEPEKCLAEFARVLRPGGLLLVSVPNRNSIVRRTQLTCHRLGERVGRSWFEFLDYSRNQYSTDEFEQELGGHGFCTERIVSFGGPLPQWVQRLRYWGPLLMFVARRS